MTNTVPMFDPNDPDAREPAPQVDWDDAQRAAEAVRESLLRREFHVYVYLPPTGRVESSGCWRRSRVPRVLARSLEDAAEIVAENTHGPNGWTPHYDYVVGNPS